MKHSQTPSQTVGPFFAYGLTSAQYGYAFSSLMFPEMAKPSTPGEQILIRGKVFDGKGNSIIDAMLEFRQADHEGNYNRDTNNGFMGFGRVGTGTEEDQSYEIKTIKPGSKAGEAPHVDVIVFMRGMLNHQYTRIYFSDEEKRNEEDPILNLVPKERRNTLLARREELNGLVIYHYDIHMQGDQETVFFDV